MTPLHQSRRKRRSEAVANRAAIATCHAIGLHPEVIARRLNLSRKCVYMHLKAIRSNDKINLRETAEALSRRAV